jgi:hypothetical protein
MTQRVAESFDFWKKNLKPTTVGERIAIGLIGMTWTAPHPDSYDSDRGCYRTSIRGTDFEIRPPGGWDSMEVAIMRAQKAYRVIADAIDSGLAEAQKEDASDPDEEDENDG